MIGSNTRDYRAGHGESLYRRSMYTFWKRAAPPASMEIFNAPSREMCTVRRERTDTPLQALVTLNDPQFVEAARHLAQRALQEGGATDREPHATSWRGGCWPGRLRPRKSRSWQATLDDLLGAITRPIRPMRRSCWRWANRSPTRRSNAADAGRLDHAGQ